VLIFIEGICVHKHELQPFKKGAARIAMESKNLSGFNIVPVAIAYDSFVAFGKNIHINIGNAINAKSLLPFEDPAQNFRYFNRIMHEELVKRIDIPQISNAKQNVFLFLPAILGIVLHTPLYYFLKSKIRKKTEGTVFYDSVLFGFLLILYPFYLLLLALLLVVYGVALPVVFIIILLHPLSAWSSVHNKK
jgi:hypothetical protein